MKPKRSIFGLENSGFEEYTTSCQREKPVLFDQTTFDKDWLPEMPDYNEDLSTYIFYYNKILTLQI